jgi:hypothetical protein
VGAAGEASAAAEWNGSAWRVVPTPMLSTEDTLYAASGASGTGGYTGFAPSVANLSGAGAAAYWVFPSSGKASHDLADGTGFNLFDSGTKAPGS